MFIIHVLLCLNYFSFNVCLQKRRDITILGEKEKKKKKSSLGQKQTKPANGSLSDSPRGSSRRADGIEGGAAEGVPARPLAVLVRRVVDPDVDPDQEMHRSYEGHHHIDQDEVGAEGPDVSAGRHRSANIPVGGRLRVNYRLVRHIIC